MLAGCSSSALSSPRHRLRSEASAAAQFQACHFQLPSSMSTQRLDLPRATAFPRKETSSRAQPLRPLGISLEKQNDSKNSSTCSLKQNIRLPPLGGDIIKGEDFWEKKQQSGKSLKRLAEHDDDGEFFTSRYKRKK